jgi:hypothetical protein
LENIIPPWLVQIVRLVEKEALLEIEAAAIIPAARRM